MRNVPTYTRPRSPEILKVSLRDAGPVSILSPAAARNPRNTSGGVVLASILKAAYITVIWPTRFTTTSVPLAYIN